MYVCMYAVANLLKARKRMYAAVNRLVVPTHGRLCICIYIYNAQGTFSIYNEQGTSRIDDS